MSDYEFDVFISYRREGNPYKWVRNHFHPRLKDHLADHLRHDPKVFIDEGMEVGSVWPDQLEDALKRTRILVPVCSPQYFRSRWCLAEWHSMAAREKLLGHSGLIYPVLFSDSDNFPSFARERSWRDLKKWNHPDPVFQQTVRWIDFLQEIEDVAIELSKRLDMVPPWQPDWPTERPDPPMPGMTPLPRF
ncbi:MAG: toll/interleukin-1 receptor domain-containing protein [Actinomycetota bacterium]|nr:toll/interleukin-1 receptor domain-containing protein [Actinomycetota bacterium]